MKKLVVFLVLVLISEIKCQEEEKEEIHNSNRTRIVGGDAISISEAPYQASLAFDGKFLCGASIISNQYLLTAAHCVQDMPKTRFSVRVGSSYSNRGGDVIKINKIIAHPQFSMRTLNYDFAILKVQTPITLIPKVKEIIKLPAADDIISDNVEVFVTGFGLTLDNSIRDDTELRGVVVPVVGKKICKRAYPFLITDQMVCAGLAAGGKDSCSGDSGGPMRRRTDNSLIGVVSFGKGCALPKLYGVYARVSSVRKWIKDQTSI